VLSLSDDLRLTVTAHFWGELPVREIAELEKVTTVAIRKRLERAYRLLEKELARDAR
jgi:DNA-directed RNA polymerase specialized sigma24 family protein